MMIGLNSMNSKYNVNYRWLILLVIFCSQLVLSIGAFGWGPLSPFLIEIMSLNKTQIGAITSALCFTSALAAFPAGIIVDRYGVKKSMLSWLGITGFPLLFLSFVHHSFFIFLIMVGIAGVCYGMGNPVASKGLFIWFDKKMRGLAFGIRQSGVSIGNAIAGILLVYISEKSGPFIALRYVSLMIMVLFLIVFFLYKKPEWAEDILPDRGSHNPQPMFLGLNILFGNRKLLTLSLVAALFGISQGVVAAFFILYLNNGLSYPLLVAGSLFSILMIGGAAGRIFWGVISDRLFDGRRSPVIIIISILAFVNMTALAFWANAWPQWLFIFVILGIGISSWGWNGITFVMVAEVSDKTKTATSVGLVSTIGWLGLSLGPLGFGCITDYFGYFYAWLFVGVLCAFATFISFLLLPSELVSRKCF